MSARVRVVLCLGVMLLLNGWGAETVQVHRFRFFIHPDLATGLSRVELHRRLAFVQHAETGAPVAGARVKVWRVRSFPPYAGELVLDAVTGATGRTPFDWWRRPDAAAAG